MGGFSLKYSGFPLNFGGFPSNSGLSRSPKIQPWWIWSWRDGAGMGEKMGFWGFCPLKNVPRGVPVQFWGVPPKFWGSTQNFSLSHAPKFSPEEQNWEKWEGKRDFGVPLPPKKNLPNFPQISGCPNEILGFSLFIFGDPDPKCGGKHREWAGRGEILGNAPKFRSSHPNLGVSPSQISR